MKTVKAETSILGYRLKLFLVLTVILVLPVLITFYSGARTLNAQTIDLNNPWENMGNDIWQVCAGGSAATDYEWGVTYNQSGPILRVTCNGWNTGTRVVSYPPYPTGDANPFTWGGVSWITGTNSSWDDGCSALHSYYTEDGTGRLGMTGGNGCLSLPTVWRRKL